MKLVTDNNNKFILKDEQYNIELFEDVDFTHFKINSYEDTEDYLLYLTEYTTIIDSEDYDYKISFMLQIFDYKDDFYQAYHTIYISDSNNYKHEIN